MDILCIFCWDILQRNADIVSTSCGHVFHHKCLLKWLMNSESCPQCRQKLTEESLIKLHVNLSQKPSSTLNFDEIETLRTRVDLKDEEINALKEANEKCLNELNVVKFENSCFRISEKNLKNEIDKLKRKLRNFVASDQQHAPPICTIILDD